jgi:hypothetical protein
MTRGMPREIHFATYGNDLSELSLYDKTGDGIAVEIRNFQVDYCGTSGLVFTFGASSSRYVNIPSSIIIFRMNFSGHLQMILTPNIL